MTISGAYNLRTILGAMGIADFLSKEADFSGIAREPQLTLSEASVPKVHLFSPHIHSTNNNKEHGAPHE